MVYENSNEIEQSGAKDGKTAAKPLEQEITAGIFKQFQENNSLNPRAGKVIWGELSEKQTDEIVKKTPIDGNWHNSSKINGTDVWAHRQKEGTDCIISKPSSNGPLPIWLNKGKVEIKHANGNKSIVEFSPDAQVNTNQDGSFRIVDTENGTIITGDTFGGIQERKSDGTVISHTPDGIVSTWSPQNNTQADGSILSGYVLTESDGTTVLVLPDEEGKYTIEGRGGRFPAGFKYDIGQHVTDFKIDEMGWLTFKGSEGDPSSFRPFSALYNRRRPDGGTITEYPDGSKLQN